MEKEKNAGLKLEMASKDNVFNVRLGWQSFSLCVPLRLTSVCCGRWCDGFRLVLDEMDNHFKQQVIKIYEIILL
jgi:hypothetical protein